jgi:hypothetical protein
LIMPFSSSVIASEPFDRLRANEAI